MQLLCEITISFRLTYKPPLILIGAYTKSIGMKCLKKSLKLQFLEFWEWLPVLKKWLPVLFKIWGLGAIFSVILAPGPSWLTERLDAARLNLNAIKRTKAPQYAVKKRDPREWMPCCQGHDFQRVRSWCGTLVSVRSRINYHQ